MAETNVQDTETWKNEARGPVGVVRVDKLTGTRVDLISPGRTVILTAEERRLTEDKVVREVDNPFRNGWLVCTSIAETSEDVARIRSDPNVISKTEIDDLFKANLGPMEKKLAAITSPVALARVLDHANDTGAATKRIDIIKARIAEVGEPPRRDPEGPVMSGSDTGFQREGFYPPNMGGADPDAARAAKTG